MKQCCRCNLTKDIDLFPKRARSSDGHGSYCRDCWKEINKERAKKLYRQQAAYRSSHRKERNQQSAEYFAANREEILRKRREKYHLQKAMKALISTPDGATAVQSPKQLKALDSKIESLTTYVKTLRAASRKLKSGSKKKTKK